MGKMKNKIAIELDEEAYGAVLSLQGKTNEERIESLANILRHCYKGGSFHYKVSHQTQN